jgi:molecular chaperone GrpE (heat shock protein)
MAKIAYDKKIAETEQKIADLKKELAGYKKDQKKEQKRLQKHEAQKVGAELLAAADKLNMTPDEMLRVMQEKLLNNG